VAAAVLLCAMLSACERGTTDPFPQVGPGQFSMTARGAGMERDLAGTATFQRYDASRTVVLTQLEGYPRLTFEGGYSGTPFSFPVGTHQVDAGFTKMAVVLELSSNPQDWYFAYDGEVRVRESDSGHIVAQFDLSGTGGPGRDVRVRGAFHALPGELPSQ
jgi:hypothetical protein